MYVTVLGLGEIETIRGGGWWGRRRRNHVQMSGLIAWMEVSLSGLWAW
jgi:hypothetical protein